MKKVLVIALIALVTVFTSCGSKTPLTEDQKEYAGKWFASDGTWLQIYNNGGGDFKMSSSNVTGGSTVITDNTITIGLLGLDTEFEIDESPYELDGAWYMELDGNLYIKD